MRALHAMLAIARYERIMLMRTVRFRILGAIAIAIPLVLGILLAVLETQGLELGAGLAVGAFVPFYVYSYVQTLLIALLVGDFRAADQRAGVAEVIGARPVFTVELVAGKFLGVVWAMGLLSLAVLVLSVAVQAAKMSITGTPVSLAPYVSSLLLMTLPALIFMVALTFLLGAVLRQQAAVSLVAIGYTLAVLFYLGNRYGGFFDFGAFYAPLYYSDLIGLGDIRRVIDQRLFYLALAMAAFGGAVELYPRLPHSRRATLAGRSLTVGGVAAALVLLGYMQQQDAAQQRARVRLLQEQLGAGPGPRITHYVLDVKLLSASAPLHVRAELQCRNPHSVPLDTLVFTLNPGLRLHRATSASGAPLEVERGESVLRLGLPEPLLPGDSTVVVLEYAGDIDRNGFDLLRGERSLHKGRWDFMKGDLTAWIRPGSTYLPPRSLWYPVAGAWYTDGERPKPFATADIQVDVPAALEVITQGQRLAAAPDDTARPPAARTRSTWLVEHPVPEFSLLAGHYMRYETRINGVDCALYVHPDHRHQVEFFADARDRIVDTAAQLLEALEQETGLPYPYPRLSIVEVPFVIQWYYEGWRESGGLVHPGILMLEEDVLMEQRFALNLRRRQERFGGNIEPAEIKAQLFLQAMFENFLSGMRPRGGLRRSPVLHMWNFERSFVSQQAPLLEHAMPLFMHERLATDLRGLFAGGGRWFGMRGGMRPSGAGSNDAAAAWDELILELQQRSLAELDAAAETEPELYRDVLEAKGKSLFGAVQAVLGGDVFRQLVSRLGAETRQDTVSFDRFQTAAVNTETDADVDLQELVHDWIHNTHVPGFTLTRSIGRRLDDGWGSVVYQVIVRIRNGEPGRGIVEINLRGRQDEVTRVVEIGGGQEVEVAMILWERPFRVMIEPFFARNRRPLIAPVSIPDEVFDELPRSYVRTVPEEERIVAEIIVDNEDEGFSMPVRRMQRFLRPGLQGDNWEIREMPLAFGRYENTFAHKAPGDGAQPAVWSTRIPHSGEYDVAYYFVPPHMARRFGFGLADWFMLSVSHSGGQVDTLRLQSDDLVGGWNLLGRFRYEEGEEAVVELSDRAGGRLYADAVRWRYVDPANPDAAYEEEVMTFGSGMSGRGAGRQPAGPPSTPQRSLGNLLDRLF